MRKVDRLSAVLVGIPEDDCIRRSGEYAHWCPACGYEHEIAVARPNGSGAKWSFDGNVEKPTFSPSINLRINTPDMKEYNACAGTTICHYFVRAGKIVFCSDCTHVLKGQTVDLPPIPLREVSGQWFIWR
jgi:Family of unknown function (DUF6527)